jgi:hypothetical protein
MTHGCTFLIGLPWPARTRRLVLTAAHCVHLPHGRQYEEPLLVHMRCWGMQSTRWSEARLRRAVAFAACSQYTQRSAACVRAVLPQVAGARINIMHKLR